jgi:hyperosmotically inducible periplasmic protein
MGVMESCTVSARVMRMDRLPHHAGHPPLATMKTKLSKHLVIMLFPLLAPLAMGEEAAVSGEIVDVTEVKGADSAWRSSDLVGTNVKTSNDDTIGEIEDLIVDFKSGEILGVVISSGGFLGIADTLTSVPTSALRYDDRTKAFKTKLTKEQLMNAPRYTNDTWESTKEGMGDKLRSYRDSMEESMEDAVDVDTSAPDNAARNEDDTGLTPLDQGNSDADLKTTKDIRAALMDTDRSFNAKNVKVITRDGTVTLRGVVESDAERASILKIAEKHSGDSTIHNQIKVKDED